MAENLILADELLFDIFEPTTQNRYVFIVDTIKSFVISKAARPKATSPTKEMHHINLIKKFKGKTTWSDIALELIDPIDSSAAADVVGWLKTMHDPITGADGYKDMYAKDCTIMILGPEGDKVQQWTLHDAWPNDVDFGGLDWSTDDPCTISVTLSYDYATFDFPVITS